MERPLQISFHNVQSSPALETAIRGHVDKLASRYDRLTGCRVTVESPSREHRTDKAFQVHIVMTVPGRELAVSREPRSSLHDRYADADVYTSLRDAFAAAERQLKDYKEHRRDDTSGMNAEAMRGQVALIEPGADHGFLLTNAGTQLYFHRDSVTDSDFAALRRGDVVHYVEESGDTGPIAVKVRAGPRAN